MKIFKNIYYSLPWYLKDRIDFYRAFKRWPNLKYPLSFNEKVLYRKRNDCIKNINYPLLADKFLVRDYVTSMIGSQYLIELYGVFRDPSDLKNIPSNLKSFVLKPNHGASMVAIIDDYDERKDLSGLILSAESWLDCDFSKVNGEIHYSKINKVLLMEERLGQRGDVLTDYKFHLFKNNTDGFFYVLQIINGRFDGELKRTFYINNLNNIYSGSYSIDANEGLLLKHAVELSKKLLSNLEYARIDWYIHNERLYFGEITLTPAGGIGVGYGNELDQLMGSKWLLPL